MNSIRQIQALNKRELENAVPPSASWHADYRDTAYIYIGGLPYDLSEGDVVTIFSQFGEPVHVNLVRDKETGKSRGFAFLKYEDQRSTDLAVDNLSGASVLGRMLRVDHVRYKRREDEDDGGDDTLAAREETSGGRDSAERALPETQRPLLKEEMELEALMRDEDDEDPMKEYLIAEKKAEVERLLQGKANKTVAGAHERASRSHRHHHRHRHRHHHHHYDHQDERRRHASRSRERSGRSERRHSAEPRRHRE